MIKWSDMSEQELLTFHMKRNAKLRGDLGIWRTTWEELALFCRPEKSDFVTKRTRGSPERVLRQYDSTAITAVQALASTLHSSLTSPSIEWFNLKMRQEDMNENDAIKEWLEDCQQRMFSAMSESNFNSQINELYLDLITFGTAAMTVYPVNNAVWDGLLFQTYFLEQFGLAENEKRVVDTVYREYRLTCRQACMLWPDAKMPKVRQGMEKDPEREFTFIHAVCFNDEGEQQEKDGLEPGVRPFLTWDICKDDKEMLETGGVYELPYVVPRWSKYPSDAMGHSPAFNALPDIRVLNDAKRYELRAWEKSIDPPYIASAGGVVGDLRLRSGGVTYLRDMNGLQQLQQLTNWNACQIKNNELETKIKEAFFIPQLNIAERPNQTATEVQIRYNLMQRHLAPQLGRLQAELLNPMIERIFYVMMRAQQLPEMPEELSQGASDMDVEYVGPLAKAQLSGEVEAIERWVMGLTNMAAGIAQVDPQAAANMLDAIDTSKLPLALADKLGTPPEAVLGETEILDKQKKRAEQQKQAQEMATAQQQAAVGKDMAQGAQAMQPQQEAMAQ